MHRRSFIINYDMIPVFLLFKHFVVEKGGNFTRCMCMVDGRTDFVYTFDPGGRAVVT